MPGDIVSSYMRSMRRWTVGFNGRAKEMGWIDRHWWQLASDSEPPARARIDIWKIPRSSISISILNLYRRCSRSRVQRGALFSKILQLVSEQSSKDNEMAQENFKIKLRRRSGIVLHNTAALHHLRYLKVKVKAHTKERGNLSLVTCYMDSITI